MCMCMCHGHVSWACAWAHMHVHGGRPTCSSDGTAGGTAGDHGAGPAARGLIWDGCWVAEHGERGAEGRQVRRARGGDDSAGASCERLPAADEA